MERLDHWSLTEKQRAILSVLVILGAFVFLSLVLEARQTQRITNMSRSNDAPISYHVEMASDRWVKVSKMSYARLSVGDVCEITRTLWDKFWTIEVCW